MYRRTAVFALLSLVFITFFTAASHSFTVIVNYQDGPIKPTRVTDTLTVTASDTAVTFHHFADVSEHPDYSPRSLRCPHQYEPTHTGREVRRVKHPFNRVSTGGQTFCSPL